VPATPARLADSNARLASARRLTRRRERRETGLFLAEGVQAVREALRRPGTVLELFATDAALERHPELLAQQPVQLISERAAARLSETVTPQGLVAVCRQRHSPAPGGLGAAPGLAAALLDAADPGNAGTILRSADAAGAAVVAFSGGVDPYGGKCVRASAGSLFHVELVIEPDSAALLAGARAAGLTVLAAAGDGEHALDELAVLARPTLWLFGNEAHGLAPDVVAGADLSVRVPIYGQAESLNLASAAAICLYASARAQRATPRPDR
jgi:TrmH family RNA methyltransferase